MEIHPVVLRRGRRQYLIGWASHDDGTDRVLTAGGRVRTFTDLPALAGAADDLGVILDPDEAPAAYDLTRVQRWAHGTTGEVNCPLLLDFWNLAEDIGRSVDKHFDATGRHASRCYDKLFYGCNLPAMTPPGRCYVPLWQPAELARLRRIIRDATGLVTRALDRCAR